MCVRANLRNNHPIATIANSAMPIAARTLNTFSNDHGDFNAPAHTNVQITVPTAGQIRDASLKNTKKVQTYENRISDPMKAAHCNVRTNAVGSVPSRVQK